MQLGPVLVDRRELAALSENKYESFHGSFDGTPATVTSPTVRKSSARKVTSPSLSLPLDGLGESTDPRSTSRAAEVTSET